MTAVLLGSQRALSTSEAEYMSLSSATQELRWLIQFLGELGFQQSPVLLHQDNPRLYPDGQGICSTF
jgi:hypothetical protein